jgi:hypothetical protein
MSPVQAMGGSAMPGRKGAFCRVRAIDSTTSGSRAQRLTLRPALAAIKAKAVPQAPAPITPTLS